MSAFLRGIEYWFLQGKLTTLLYGISAVLASIAMFGAALLSAPRPYADFQIIRPPLRLIFTVILLIFAVIVYVDAWWTTEQVKRRLSNEE